MNERERIASRIARELRDGMVVNLGIGLPTLVADYIPPDVRIVLQSENGILGMGHLAEESEADSHIVNAGGRSVTVLPGACFFDSAFSFGIIRGGHVNLAVLGALEVDEKGNLASHIVPGKSVPGMGGAMDLAVGARRVIIAMTHTAKGGRPKILREITLPMTAAQKAGLIVTELAVIEVTPAGLVLREVAEGTTPAQVQALTGAELAIPADISCF